MELQNHATKLICYFVTVPKDNIDYINRIYSTILPGTTTKDNIKTDPKIISKIDQLLTKFLKLAE
jgi:hypothetical protein